MNRLAAASFLVICVVSGAWAAGPGNQPPDVPSITEPESDGLVLNPGDVHMNAAPFSDPDPGDTHDCSDWTIWRADLSERVWSALCVTGPERYHIHLGDGIFENSHAGRADLEPSASYVIRTRHRDDSGEGATEWSGWAARPFDTGPASTIFPLLLDDVLDVPPFEWQDTTGNDIVLPGGPGEPFVRLESAAGELLLEIRGLDGVTHGVVNPGPLPTHVPVRVLVDGGATGLGLPSSDLRISDDEGDVHTVLLPALALAASTREYFWVASGGATYVGAAPQAEPDFTTVARGLELPWEAQLPGFAVEVFAEGFQLPVNIAFVPDPGGDPGDPLFYVTELYGTIKVVTRDGTVGDYATGLLNYNPEANFPGSGEQGLTGIVVEPVTGDVLASMLYEPTVNPQFHYPKVERFGSVDGGLTAATQTTVLDMEFEVQGASHQISNLTIGPDGKLYVHMGDGFNTATAQNLNSFRGKILRVNLDGSAPADNPFWDDSDGINARDYVFSYGVRNPFGGAWRESDGRHYCVENGPAVDRFAAIVSGRNYLWDNSNASMEQFALYNWSPATGPVNLAFVQNGTFCGSGFPIERFDRAYVTESGATYATGPQSLGKRITEFVLDSGGNLVSGPLTFLDYIGNGKATAAALAAGPDGLYFSELYRDLDYVSPADAGARILRLRWTGGPRVDLRLDGATIQWGAVAGALNYDVVRGDLGTLRAAGGDFTAATTTCAANDLAVTSMTDTDSPAAGAGFWYLVRDIHVSHVGCYESGATSQFGGRDGEIAGAAPACR